MSVAVLIPTYNESREVLLPTVAAAVALEPAHETWVLDDGARPWVREMAEAIGARYVARVTHEHAKAGNINHALGIVEADLLAILDADHVAHPDFLLRTLGYFRDPKVAVVQTPQEFYNVTSFEHGSGRTFGERFHEQTLFYRLLEPGKNRWNAAFWCGTNAVVRASGPARGGRLRDRDDHRGHPHHDPLPSPRLAQRLPQRGPRPRPRRRRRGAVPAPAEPLGHRRDAGPQDREPARGARPATRPAPRLRRDAARLVRRLADARLPDPAAGRAPHRRDPDRRRRGHVRALLRHHLRAPAARPVPAGPWRLPADPVDPVRARADDAQPAGHADPRPPARAALRGHARRAGPATRAAASTPRRR